MCTAVCFVLKILHCRRWVTEAVTKTQRTQSGYQRCEHDSSRSFSRWPVRNKSSICLNHRVIIVKISSRTWSWSCCYICVNHSESTWKERVDLLVTLRQLRKYWVAAPSQPPSFLWKPRGLWVRFNVELTGRLTLTLAEACESVGFTLHRNQTLSERVCRPCGLKIRNAAENL